MQERTAKDQSVADQLREHASLADTATAKSDSKLDVEFAPNLDAKLEADFATELATNAGSKRSSSAAPSSRVNSDRKQNSLSPSSKAGLKSDANLAAKPAGNSLAAPAAAPSVPMTADGISSAAVATLPSVSEKGDFSSIAPNLGGASNLQSLAEQFSEAVGSAPSGSQTFYVPNAASNASKSNVADSLALSPVPIAPGSFSAGLATGIGLATSYALSHTADSFSDLAAQSLAGELQSAAPQSPAFASADSSLHASIPSGETDVNAVTIASIGDIPTDAAAPVQLAVSAPATLLVQGASFQHASSQATSSQGTSLSPPKSSPEALTPSSAQSSTHGFSATATSNIDSQTSSFSSTLIPTPQPAAGGSNPVPAGASPNGMQTTVPSSSGADVASMPVSSAMATPTAAEPASTSSSAPRDAVPIQFHSPAVNAAVSRISRAPETGAAIASNRNHGTSPPEADNKPTNAANEYVDDYAGDYASNFDSSYAINHANFSSSLNSSRVTSNSTANPDLATPLAVSAAVTNDPVGSVGAFAEAQLSSTAASPATASDKKSIVAGQPNAAPAGIAAPRASSSGIPVFGTSASDASASGSPASAPPLFAASLHNVPVVIAPGRDASTTLTVPAPPASSPAPPASSEPTPVLPQAHQMLDSASAAPTVPATPIAPGSVADLQMNGQMHMGVRTDAFGAVEIHTVVAQSQVGITVHADRDISRWFSSEVSGLESGLNNSHLNLTGVNFDHGRSGVQTATGFSNGQPRQNFSQPHQPQSAGSRVAATPEPAGAAEAATVDILPSDRPAGPLGLGLGVGNHFSVHV
jgi:hypothetical protein